MDCKRAFEEAKGDLARARELIKEKGFAKAEKKASGKPEPGSLKHMFTRAASAFSLKCGRKPTL